MRVLIAHNRYNLRGGEESVVEAEAAILREAGTEVSMLMLATADFMSSSSRSRVLAALSGGRFSPGRSILRDVIAREEPDVVHFHNLYPMFGSGAIEDAASYGYATVRTLHNFRLTCIAGTHFRNGRVCEECSARRRLPGVVRGCYRGSKLQSAAMAASCCREWRIIIEQGLPDILVCLSDFSRYRMIEAGVPEDRVIVKANSVASGSPLPWNERDGALFVGRLSREKGVLELLEAWPSGEQRLRVVGDGPLRDEVQRLCATKTSLSYVGYLDRDDIRRLMRTSRLLVVPSLLYEGLPTVALEAFSEGTPVVSFSIGWFLDIQETLGVSRIEVGDFEELIRECGRILACSDKMWNRYSLSALKIHSERFSDSLNVRRLLDVYFAAIARAQERGPRMGCQRYER